jgi:hypothetical protein
MICNDSTDDTAAFNALLTTVYNAGGGTIFVNGTCLISSAEITLPNNGASIPTQPSIRITSPGGGANGRWGALPASPGVLDLRYSASVAKIDTRGAGYLEIDHIILKDGGNDCTSFVQSTNTTLHIHDVAFSGTANGVSACNDAIILGGTGTTINGTSTAPFQGYGTVIENNFFDRVRRAVYGQTYANGTTITKNTVSSSSGNSLAGGKAIEFNGVSSSSDTANFIFGNLIETPSYTYGIGFTSYSVDNIVNGNSCFDGSGSFTACVYFGATSVVDNFSEANYAAGLPQTIDANGQNTIIDPSGNGPTEITHPWNFSGGQNTNKLVAPSTVAGMSLYATNDGGFAYEQFTTGTQPLYAIAMSTQGGAIYNPFSITQTASNTTQFTFGASGNANTYLTGVSGGDIRLLAPSGQTLWICDTCNEIVQFGNAGYTTNFKSGIESAGTKFTTDGGCSETSLVGGTQSGALNSGTSGTCTFVVTMGGGVNATHAWSCWANDITTPADAIRQRTVGSASVTFSGTTVSGDLINFGCLAY